MLLGPDDPLPHLPQRILVNGSSGAGETTLAAGLAGRLGIPHTELDALHHGPGWVRRPEFLDDVLRWLPASAGSPSGSTATRDRSCSLAAT